MSGGLSGGVTGVPVPPRSPPRPSPGGLHYSDEDICNKYNGAALTEGGTLQEKSGDATESEVGACYTGPPPSPGAPLPPQAPQSVSHVHEQNQLKQPVESWGPVSPRLFGFSSAEP